MGKERNKTIDIMKGFGILFVIIGHIFETPEIFRIWIYSFHLSLFLFCSGLVFSAGDFKKFIISKIKSLVIPYFFLGLLLWAVKTCRAVILDGFIGYRALLRDFYKTSLSLILAHRLHEYYFTLWFICALFFSELLMFFIIKKIGNRPGPYLIISVSLVFLQYFVFKIVYGFYWSIDLVPYGTAFLSLGYCFRLNKRVVERYLSKHLILIPVFALSILFTILNFRAGGRVEIYACYFGNPVYFGLSSAFGIFTIMIISSMMESSKLFEYLGRNTFVIYAFQNGFAIPVAHDFVNWLKPKSSLCDNEIFLWLVIVCVSVIITMILVELTGYFFPWCGRSSKYRKMKMI